MQPFTRDTKIAMIALAVLDLFLLVFSVVPTKRIMVMDMGYFVAFFLFTYIYDWLMGTFVKLFDHQQPQQFTVMVLTLGVVAALTIASIVSIFFYVISSAAFFGSMLGFLMAIISAMRKPLPV